ncbi:MAG: GtrA family protein [Paracoccaceae bacterium]
MTAVYPKAAPLQDGHGLLRFLLVGGVAALAYSLVTAALVGWLSTRPALISALVWLAFIPPVFWCHRHFTFRERQARKGALGLYALTQGLSLAIVSTAGALFVRHEMIADTAIYLAASAVAAVTSYGLNRALVFADPAAE